ncbi:MAG: nucleotidyltransferase domain-containing protein [Promethearchaeota archaeon]
MNFIEGIEGDYIETKDSNLFFDVKGLLHPNDRKICFLRFYPHPEGDRIKKNVKFKKIYDLDERYSLIKNKYPKYLFYSNQLDLEVQSVKNHDIKKIYTPREFFHNLSKKENISNVEQLSYKLCELIINKGGISRNSLGITGSIMVGLNKQDSDIDIIIYGTENAYTFQEKLLKLFKESGDIRRYNLDEYRAHYIWRAGGSDISFKDFMKSEQRKLHQGKYHGFNFFFRYIKSPKDWKGNFYDYKYTNLGRIKVKALVTNSKDSLFTPCSYKINSVVVLEKFLTSNDINFENIVEVNSFRGRFCEQANEGEFVTIEGKLERVNYKNKLEYYRILLTDQSKDKMVIIN